MTNEQQNTTKIAVLATQMENIEKNIASLDTNMKEGFEEINKKIDNLIENFVEKPVYKSNKDLTDRRINLLEKINFGAIGLILTIVLSGIIYLVVK